MSTNRYIDKLKARLAKEADQRMQLQALLDDQVARNRALLAERDRLREALIYARKEAIYGLNHAKTHLQACAALGRISGGTDHALQGAQP